MNQSEALKKARAFADTAYNAEMERILRDGKDDLAKMRNGLAARGMSLSGMQISETARIQGAQIRALANARLEALLEGCELHSVVIDDSLAQQLCEEIINHVNTMLDHGKRHRFQGALPASAIAAYPGILSTAVGISVNTVRTTIDRRRLASRKEGAMTTIFNVQGDNARWYTNSQDHSVNVINRTSAEFFASLRQAVGTAVQAGEEQEKIIEAVNHLEAAQGQKSFGQRYTDFVALAANHMAIIGPFIPALSEMLHKVL